MSPQATAMVDVQSAAIKYRDLVVRIKTAVEGQNADKQDLHSSLVTIQKEMARTLSRAHRHAPSRKYREKDDAFINSFGLTFKVLEQALQRLIEIPNTSQYIPPAIPADATFDTWQESCEDLADMAIDAERGRTKQRRESINSVLEFLDALDRLLDDNGTHEHFLEHLLEMFHLMRIKAISNLTSVGLEKIALSVGNPLDPACCEVVDSESDDGINSIVLKQLRAGYMLDGKVFRKAAVIVGNAK